MANRKVSVYRYVNLGDGKWRYVRPVMNKNHTFSRELVWLNGKQERHTEGSFYLGWYEGGKKCWRKLGDDPDRITDFGPMTVTIHAALKIQEARLLQGDTAPGKTKDQLPSDFRTAIALFLADLESGARKGLKPARAATVALFRQTLTEFAEFAGWEKFPSMAQMRRDIFRYRQWLEDRKKAPGTIGKKIDRLNQFIRVELGLRAGEGPVKRSDFDQWGYYDEDNDVAVYADEQIAKFFGACDGVEHLLFSVCLESGFRAQEVSFLTWADVDLNLGKLTVSRKQGFNPKTKQSLRSVTVSKALIARLRAYQETSTSQYVFSRFDRPLSTSVMLDACKRVAKRAGMNPVDFNLHKWRHTHATRFLMNCRSAAGALKMLMARLGHKDMKTTEVYLAYLPAEEEQAIVDQMSVGGRVDMQSVEATAALQ